MAAADNAAPSAWSPFRHRTFLVIWSALVMSNVGSWMHDVGAGWLMTELSPSPLIVAAVQAATTLPVFLFALIAGAVADIVDKRRLLILINVLMGGLAAVFAVLVAMDVVTPWVLLIFTFLMGTGMAFMAPAGQAIVPMLVPRPELPAAIALNSMGLNVSRAIGPALAGFLIVGVGQFAPFALNAVSFVGIIAALVWWTPPPAKPSALPREQVPGAIRAGIVYAWHSSPLKQTLLRAVGFFVFASAYWAMLPLIAREVLAGGPTLYGILLGAVGAGAVGGAVVMPKIRAALGPDRTVMAGTLGIASVLAIAALVPIQAVAVALSLVAGASWIAVLSSLHVSAQTALPDWVRGRGLSIFLMVFFGSMAAGSLIWGQIAGAYGIPTALLVAAAGAVLALPLTARAKLNQGAEMDLSPALHWPAPSRGPEEATGQGAVMVQIAYRVPTENRVAYLDLMRRLGSARRRHGGYHWTLLEDADEPDRFVETWFESSWIDHLRHHERVSGDDKALQAEVRKLLVPGADPEVRHFLAPDEKERQQ